MKREIRVDADPSHPLTTALARELIAVLTKAVNHVDRMAAQDEDGVSPWVAGRFARRRDRLAVARWTPMGISDQLPTGTPTVYDPPFMDDPIRDDTMKPGG